MKTYKFLIFLLIFVTSVFNIEATIKVYTVTGKVSVKVKGGSKALKKGDVIGLDDMLTIPNGSQISVSDDTTNKIYSSQNSGKISVRKLIMDAREKAGNKLEDINKQLKGGSATKTDNKQRVYAESGMSKRKLSGDVLISDSPHFSTEMIAVYLRKLIYENNDETSIPIPVVISKEVDQELNLEINNTLKNIVYYSVIVINRNGDIEILNKEDSDKMISIKPRSSVVLTLDEKEYADRKAFLLISRFNIDPAQLTEVLNTTAIDEDSFDFTSERPQIFVKELK